jgi:hypothetical protein
MNLLPPRPKNGWEFALNFVGLAVAAFILPGAFSLTRELGHPLWPIVLLGVIWAATVVWEVVMLMGFIRDRHKYQKVGNPPRT